MSAITTFKAIVKGFKEDNCKNWAAYSVLIKEFNEAKKHTSEEQALEVLKEAFPSEED